LYCTRVVFYITKSVIKNKFPISEKHFLGLENISNPIKNISLEFENVFLELENIFLGLRNVFLGLENVFYAWQ